MQKINKLTILFYAILSKNNVMARPSFNFISITLKKSNFGY